MKYNFIFIFSLILFIQQQQYYYVANGNAIAIVSHSEEYGGILPYASGGSCVIKTTFTGSGLDFETKTLSSCSFSPNIHTCSSFILNANSTHFRAQTTLTLTSATYTSIDINLVLSDGNFETYTLTDKNNNIQWECENPPQAVTAPVYVSGQSFYVYSSFVVNNFYSFGMFTLKSDFKRPLAGASMNCAAMASMVCKYTYIDVTKYMVEFWFNELYSSTYSTTWTTYLADNLYSISLVSPFLTNNGFLPSYTYQDFDMLPFKTSVVRQMASVPAYPIINTDLVPLYGTSLKDCYFFFKTDHSVKPTQIINYEKSDWQEFNQPYIPQRFISSWPEAGPTPRYVSFSVSTNTTRLYYYRESTSEKIYNVYPYGLMFSAANFISTSVFSSVVHSQNTVYTTHFAIPEPNAVIITLSNSDIVAPVLKGVDIIVLNGTTSVLRATATDDLSGVHFIRVDTDMQTIYMYPKHREVGVATDGTYETYVNFKKNTPLSIRVQDNSGNYKQYSKEDIKFLFNFPLASKSPTLALVAFNSTAVNTIFSETTVALYVKIYAESVVQRAQENSLFLRLFITQSDIRTIAARYDESVSQYIFEFVIPKRLAPGNLRYSLFVNQLEYTSMKLMAKWPSVAVIAINNDSEFDVMAPFLANVVTSASQTIDTTLTTPQVLSWTLFFKDSTGISKIVVTIASEYDIQGKNFTVSSLSDQDVEIGINYPVDPTRCRKTKFQITYIYTEDVLGNKAEAFRHSSTDINPLYLFDQLTQDHVSVQCLPTDNSESVRPTITSLKISPVTLNTQSKYSTKVEFTLTDNTGISSTHTPVCYFIGTDGDYINSYAGFDSPTSTYFCSFDFPYGFGPTALLSIFGISDTFYNLNGYTAEKLETAGFDNAVTLTPLNQPIIEYTSSLKESSDILYINGHGFGIENPSLCKVNVLSSNGMIQFIPTISTATSLVIVDLPSAPTYTVQVVCSSTLSNTIIIPGQSGSSSSDSGDSSSSDTPVVTPSPSNTPVTCNSDCGLPQGYGKCINGACVCNPHQSGIDCKSKVDNGTVITPDPTKPTVNVTIPGTSSGETPKFTSFVSVIALRELDNSNTPVNNYVFNSNKWILVNEGSSSNNQVTTIQYKYIIDEVNTNITSTVQVFSQSTNITFGNQQLFMNPSTIKFTFNITSYPFSKSTNALQLVMTAALESTDSITCSYKEFIDDQSNSQYLKLQIEDRSLFGRFIKFGMIDSREQVVTNTQLDNSYGGKELSKSTSDQSYIGLNIPYYTKYALLDPDFSVLIESRSAGDQENSICTSSSKKLTNGQIAGIVVGGVVFLFIITAVIVYFLSRKGNSAIAVKLRRVVGTK